MKPYVILKDKKHQILVYISYPYLYLFLILVHQVLSSIRNDYNMDRL